MEEVVSIDLAARRVRLCESSVSYTYLVIGLGGKTFFFGNEDFERHALGLKTVQDALDIRKRVLTSFERAETEADPDEVRRLTTICVIGGGPTGVELAGTMAELARQVFSKDFRKIDPNETRVILVQGNEHVLPNYPEKLCLAARRQLEELGVDVRVKTRAQRVGEASVELDNGEVIETRNILWGGGVTASPVTQTLGVPLDRRGRIEVEPDCSLPGYPDAFAIGDIASLVDAEGQEVPGVAQGAMQMGRHVAELIEDELHLRHGGRSVADRPAFAYHDKGDMATIGRNKAVAWLYKKVQLQGFPAWVIWALVHLLFLVGFRNKVATLVQWLSSYISYKPGARIIFSPLERERLSSDDGAEASDEASGRPREAAEAAVPAGA
jgi:NADH dehydrogenase